MLPRIYAFSILTKYFFAVLLLDVSSLPLQKMLNFYGSFYRAMLCISAVYAGMQCLSVCHVRELRQNE